MTDLINPRIEIDRYLVIWDDGKRLFASDDSWPGCPGQRIPKDVMAHIAEWRDEWRLEGVFDREHGQIIDPDEVMELVDELIREAREQAEAERAQPYSWAT